jgi:Arc/MetJ family transcription regulator
VRTNIEIDDAYVQTIMARFGLRTKTAAVDLALRHLAGQPMTRRRWRCAGRTPSPSRLPTCFRATSRDPR